MRGIERAREREAEKGKRQEARGRRRAARSEQRVERRCGIMQQRCRCVAQRKWQKMSSERRNWQTKANTIDVAAALRAADEQSEAGPWSLRAGEKVAIAGQWTCGGLAFAGIGFCATPQLSCERCPERSRAELCQVLSHALKRIFGVLGTSSSDRGI